jgi:hypothetical protein
MVEPTDGAEYLRAVVTIVHPSAMPRRATKNPITKNPALVARASKGGKARAAKLTAKERSLIAKHAARARWRQSWPLINRPDEVPLREWSVKILNVLAGSGDSWHI